MASRSFNIVWQSASSSSLENQTDNSSAARDIQCQQVPLLKSVLKQTSELQGKVIVVKLPSCVIEDEELLTNFAENIHLLNSLGVKLFIVHGYVNMINETMKSLGFQDTLLEDIKITDHKSAQIIEMVLSGYINKKIVSKLCAFGCNTIGLSGKDANLIQVEKAKFLRKYNVDSDVINVGFTGEPEIVNTEILLNFEENNIIPVISPISHDSNGRTHLLDVNMTASIISAAIDADHLVLLSEYELFGNRDLKFDDEISAQNLLHSVKADSKYTDILKSILWATERSTRLVHFHTVTCKDALLTTLFSL